METQAYLIFELNDLQYGVETTQVREIFQLPELTPVADAPGDIIGLLNFRGKILPIMHLAKRLGQETLSCQLSDRVIVIEWQGLQVGVVVNRVYDVQTLPASSIESAPTYDFRNHSHTAFAAGIAKVDDTLVTVLNPETLIRQSDDVVMMAWEAKLNDLDDLDDPSMGTPAQLSLAYPNEQVYGVQQQLPVLTNFFNLYCPGITSEEQHIFHQRALELRRPLESSDISDLMPLAVIGLGGEYFGIDLRRVREFIDIRQVMPIPCCPPHILGNMNLRGEIITLIDIHQAINLSQSESSGVKAVVVDVDDMVVAVCVDQVLDVIYLSSVDMATMPTAIAQRSRAFFQGSARYHQKTLGILDISKILFQGGLVVDQAA